MTKARDHGAAVVADVRGQLRMTCVNVGMGDCTIIVLPDERVVVIDCGSSARTGVTWDQVRAHLPLDAGGQLRPIELLVLTHADKDHYNMVLPVIGGIRVNQIRHSRLQNTYTNRGFAHWRFLNANNGPMVQVDVNPAAPDEVVLIDGGALTSGPRIGLLAVAASVPSAYTAPGMIKNTGSVVTLCRAVTDGGHEHLFLIGADGTCETERFMLDPGRVDRIRDAEIMRVGHHGSDSSSSPAFIDVVRPQAALISSSQHRRYGLPKQSVVDRWIGALPIVAEEKRVGYYEDGVGTVCRGNNRPDLDLEDWGLEDLGYAWGGDDTETEMYETLVDGSQTWTWA